MQIYTPSNKDNVGPGASEDRDCIDICVKLVFGLNKFGREVDIIELLSSSNKSKIEDVIPLCIKEITNDRILVKELFCSPQESVARVRQTSDDEVRTKIHQFIVAINEQLKIAASVSSALKTALQNRSIAALDPVDDIIERVKESYKINGSDLIGSVEETFTE